MISVELYRPCPISAAVTTGNSYLSTIQSDGNTVACLPI